MRAFAVAMMAGLVLAGPLRAEGWQSPARGSALRADLMDALRPVVEWELGSPVAFVVDELRVKEGRAFAMVVAQRPGGKPIDLAATPMVARGDFDPELVDVGAGVQAFWVQSGRNWVVVQWAVGATDVWYQWEPICAVWGDLVPEACGGM